MAVGRIAVPSNPPYTPGCSAQHTSGGAKNKGSGMLKSNRPILLSPDICHPGSKDAWSTLDGCLGSTKISWFSPHSSYVYGQLKSLQGSIWQNKNIWLNTKYYYSIQAFIRLDKFMNTTDNPGNRKILISYYGHTSGWPAAETTRLLIPLRFPWELMTHDVV